MTHRNIHILQTPDGGWSTPNPDVQVESGKEVDEHGVEWQIVRISRVSPISDESQATEQVIDRVSQMTQQMVDRVLYRTVDPTVSLDGKPCPAMTTLLHRVCDNNEEKFEEALRVAELFITKAIREGASMTLDQQRELLAASL